MKTEKSVIRKVKIIFFRFLIRLLSLSSIFALAAMSRHERMRRKIMKKCLIPFMAAALVSCQMLGTLDENDSLGELRISFVDDPVTRSAVELPDTSDFLLTVSSSDGRVIYDGAYGDSPESIMVDAGSYVVNVRSCDFRTPAFSKPQFGDEQCVVVPSGGVANVRLTCVQINAGIRLNVDESFLSGCPDGVLFLKSSQGKLMYGYSEKRIAYFLPGSVTLMLSEGGTDRQLFTKNLQAQSVLVVNVSVADGGNEASGESISVAVDTTRNWLEESYVIGGGGSSGKGGSISDALTVSQAIASAGQEDVWVCGYIVGGDLTSASASFEPPFTSRTNILLGSRSSTSVKSSCLSVNLPSGSIRDDLNLPDNPSLLGRRVYLRGDIVEAYYGIPGLKNVTDYELR